MSSGQEHEEGVFSPPFILISNLALENDSASEGVGSSFSIVENAVDQSPDLSPFSIDGFEAVVDPQAAVDPQLSASPLSVHSFAQAGEPLENGWSAPLTFFAPSACLSDQGPPTPMWPLSIDSADTGLVESTLSGTHSSMPSLETAESAQTVSFPGDDLVVFGTLASPLPADNLVAHGSTSPPPLQSESGTGPLDYHSSIVEEFRLLFGRTPTTEECWAFPAHDDTVDQQ